jgi:hypothetical protein
VYVQPFKTVPQPVSQITGAAEGHNLHDATGMYVLSRVLRSDGSRMGGILPLGLLRMPVDVSPRFGVQADPRLTAQNVMESSREFWLGYEECQSSHKE